MKEYCLIVVAIVLFSFTLSATVEFDMPVEPKNVAASFVLFLTGEEEIPFNVSGVAIFILKIVINFINIYKKINIGNDMEGRFKPKNPDKYKGNPTNIIYRSSWELKLMLQYDKDPNVIKWGSEEKIIWYRSPIDNKMHRYFIDFEVYRKNGDKITKELIEVKPHHQTIKPVKGKKKEKTYFNEVCTWGVNQAKWKAAKKYCEENGYEFKLITEYELGLKKKK